MTTVTINGTKREATGKKASKLGRREGQIPCVLYGGDDVVHFTTVFNDIKPLIYTPEFKVAEVNVNGTAHKAIVKDVQFHPVKESVVHVDFLRLVEGTTIKLELPVKFVGNSPGVKLGGKLQQSMRRVKVKTKPEHMVDSLTLDISTLELGQAIRVRDIEVPEGVELMSAPGTPVASVEIPRALRSAAAEAAKAQ